MRLSAEPDSPFYDRARANRATPLLDDRPLDLCIEADEEAGWVRVLVRAIGGGVAKDEQGRFVTEIRRGRVTLLDADDAP